LFTGALEQRLTFTVWLHSDYSYTWRWWLGANSSPRRKPVEPVCKVEEFSRKLDAPIGTESRLKFGLLGKNRTGRELFQNSKKRIVGGKGKETEGKKKEKREAEAKKKREVHWILARVFLPGKM